MIAFGASITSPEAYDLQAGPGLRRVAEPDSVIYPYQAGESVSRVYNLMLDHAGAHEDLEALVLVHQDAELVDPGICARVRAVLADPAVGMAGVVGSVGATSIAWWDGDVRWSGCTYRYGDFGGGELGDYVPDVPARIADAPEGEVDTLYGVVLVLSPWAVRTLRFDESLGPMHGHDFDFGRQVRAAGRTLVTAPFGVVHHHPLHFVANPEAWAASHRRVAEKWDADGPEDDSAWKPRARAAEADAGAGHLLVASRALQADAGHWTEVAAHDRLAHTLSWRATRPLRELRLRRSGGR